MSHRVQRALVSVFDKDGVVDLVRGLVDAGVEIVSSGGTAKLLREGGLPVAEVSEITEFPEMMDGRVKTLHPRIHGGILAVRTEPSHLEAMKRHGIRPIDLVVVNLYPFERTASDPSKSRADAVEMIDIGGPSMVRSAAKNHAHVGVVVDPADYAAVLAEIAETGGLCDATRSRLAARAFAHTASYDAAIHDYLSRTDDAGYPDTVVFRLDKAQDLRYGENPHQTAGFHVDPAATAPSVARAHQIQGKELSFNNILDLDAALVLASAFSECACAVIKHGNPCGAALGSGPEEAFREALRCDPVSAFGGVIAFNRPVDGTAASAIREAFYEAVIAPSFEDDAREALRKKKKLRLLETGALGEAGRQGRDLRRVAGGVLIQDWDDVLETVRECTVATKRAPTDTEWNALAFAWTVCKFVKSNAIVYTDDRRTLGIGAGQMSRVDSARFAVQKAQTSLQGAVMASDAFFPFRDGLDVGAEAGIRAVVQPGGSVRDEEVIAAADEHDIAMVFTGRRHFRH
jgi:phosphoribosylaminoimidazolecarboxamide formyltransferase/IMP cyclohydrolase